MKNHFDLINAGIENRAGAGISIRPCGPRSSTFVVVVYLDVVYSHYQRMLHPLCARVRFRFTGSVRRCWGGSKSVQAWFRPPYHRSIPKPTTYSVDSEPNASICTYFLLLVPSRGVPIDLAISVKFWSKMHFHSNPVWKAITFD